MSYELRSKRTERVTIHLTPEERRKLRSLAIRSPHGSEQGIIRQLVRDAWTARQKRRASQRQGKDT